MVGHLSLAGYACLCCCCATHAPTPTPTLLLLYVKHTVCLLRKQLHSPHVNDLLAPPRGAHPKQLKGGRLLWSSGACIAFFLTRGAYSGYCSRYR